MKGPNKLIAGVLIGAGLMYLLDPDRGRRRRALVRDQATRIGRRVGEDVEARSRDLRNRAQGAAAELRSRFRPEDVDDERLEERIRSALGRATSHPGAIQVAAFRGRVTLSGPILEEEADAVLRAVRGVSGVRETVNELEVRSEAGNTPSLQDESRSGSVAGRSTPGR